MTQRRARAIEALGLIVVLWGMGRASVVFLGAPIKSPPMPHARDEASPKAIPNMTHLTTRPVAMMAPLESNRPAGQGNHFAPKRIFIAPSPTKGHVPEIALPKQPFMSSTTTGSDDPSFRHTATDNALDVADSPKQTWRRKPLQGAAWVIWRPDAAGQPLGAGGQLGGSQAGARIILPVALQDRLRLSLRAYAPLEQLTAYEVAPGISLRPFPAIPIELIAERRLRAGRQTQDATSVFLAGGGSSAKRGSAWRADVYAQAGMVGLQNPMLFADGAATVRRSIGSSHAIGLGLWGGIQPGLKRLDIGPSAKTMIGPSSLNTRLTLDWRVRVAGDARPGSGVAITISKDF